MVVALDIDVDPSEFGFSNERLALLKPAFNRYVEDRRLAGWLATISRGGQLVWSDKGGDRDRERSLPVEDDTIWRIYSMTKPVIGIAVMILYEEGHFELSDDIGQWIDGFREPRVWTGGTEENPESVPAEGPVRVVHLLTHMSGLTYGFQYRHPTDAMYRRLGYNFGFAKGADLDQAIRDWTSVPLLFEPGTRWNYGVSFDVLGRLIEIWSGQRLDDFVKERILDPLEMHDTEWWTPPEKADRLAMLYVPSDGASVPFESLANAVLHPPTILNGSGGLNSTAHDYERFMAMLVRGGELDGKRIVSRASLELMTTNHLPGGGDLVALAVDSNNEPYYTGLGFGYSMFVIDDARANRTLASEGAFGWGGAASTTFLVDPAKDLTMAFYTQLLPSGTYPIRRDLERLVYGALVD
jgi:CubicO group peptidase (beta-lactamase class C family)